jgi:hypothetical protein
MSVPGAIWLALIPYVASNCIDRAYSRSESARIGGYEAQARHWVQRR